MTQNTAPRQRHKYKERAHGEGVGGELKLEKFREWQHVSNTASFVSPGGSAEIKKTGMRSVDLFPTAIARLDAIQKSERENSPGDQPVIGVRHSAWQCDCHGHLQILLPRFYWIPSSPPNLHLQFFLAKILQEVGQWK
jgi:hypothetical protein